MRFINLFLNSVEIGFDSSHSISQQYAPIEATTVLRMSDGSALKQTAYSGKTRITTSGTGRNPLPTDGLNYASQIAMKCVDPVTEYSASNTITLPASRRSDVDSIGFAVVNGRSVRTSISISGNTATLTTVAGATGYEVIYYPTFNVFIKKPQTGSTTRTLNSRSWSFEAVEV